MPIFLPGFCFAHFPSPDSRINPKIKNPSKNRIELRLSDFSFFWNLIGSEQIKISISLILIGANWSVDFWICKIQRSGAELSILLWFKFSKRSRLQIIYRSGADFDFMNFIGWKQIRTKSHFRMCLKICYRTKLINAMIRDSD